VSDRKPSNIDKVKWALYRTATAVRPEKLAKAKWVVYSAVAISSVILFACDAPTYPKVPRNQGD
jgi:hypothetical protein